jgi:hypothetical protein
MAWQSKTLLSVIDMVFGKRAFASSSLENRKVGLFYDTLQRKVNP